MTAPRQPNPHLDSCFGSNRDRRRSSRSRSDLKVADRPGAGIRGRQQEFPLPAVQLGAYWIAEPVSNNECRIHPHKTKDPAEAAPSRSRGPCLLPFLLLAPARRGESGESDAKQRESGWLGRRGRGEFRQHPDVVAWAARESMEEDLIGAGNRHQVTGF